MKIASFALKLFDEMLERNLVSGTSMISGYTQNHREDEAVGLYLGMLRSWLSLDQFCLGSVVRSCLRLSDVELGRQLRCQVVKLDYGLQWYFSLAIWRADSWFVCEVWSGQR